MAICAPVIGLWYWCTDQYIVQRALGAPNETQARRGSIAASFFKLLPVFIFIIPGMICFALASVMRLSALDYFGHITPSFDRTSPNSGVPAAESVRRVVDAIEEAPASQHFLRGVDVHDGEVAAEGAGEAGGLHDAPDGEGAARGA